MIEIKEGFCVIHTVHTSMVVDLRHENAILAYYGTRLQGTEEFFTRQAYRSDDWRQRSVLPFMVSGTGRGEFKNGAVLIKNADGSCVCDFCVCDAVLSDTPEWEDMPSARGASQTVRITYRDQCGCVLYQYLSVFDECDAIVSRFILQNEASASVEVLRLASLQLDLYGDNYNVINFSGQWADERHAREHRLAPGIFVNESKDGASSARFNPGCILYGSSGKDWYVLNLIWSGNHKTSFECQENNTTRVLIGLNDAAFQVRVMPGESFVTPQAVLVYAHSCDAITQRIHAFVNAHILRGPHSLLPRDIVINSWESFYFDFDESSLLCLAKSAADIGIETFVLDDGWFMGRRNDRAGLGDWHADGQRFPSGLKQFAREVRSLGLKFGLWVEPEMVNEDSDLFREHPEWAMCIGSRAPVRMRNQLMLDLANEEVVAWLFQSLSELFGECRPDYIKWDFNRFATDIPAGYSIGEYDYLYYRGLYRLLNGLRKQYPEIVFESCASGGARFDLGMLCYSEYIWTSDNTDAKERLRIQADTARLYPQSVISCHVSSSPNHQTGNSTSLENCFNVASGGALGYELNLTELSDGQMAVLREQVAFYKKHRVLLQFGEYHALSEEENGADGWCIVSKDKRRAIAMLALLHKKSRYTAPYRFRLKGLEEKFYYKITQRKQCNAEEFKSLVVSGTLLCNGWLAFGDFYRETDRTANSNSIASRLFLLERIG